MLALPEGSRALIGTGDGNVYTVQISGGRPARRSIILTQWFDRHGGINLWEFAKGDGRTDDTHAINYVLALAVMLGVRTVNFGTASRTYLLGGPSVTYGVFPTPGGDVPFPRHKVRLYSDLALVGQGATLKLAGGATYPGGIFGHPFWHGERLHDVKIEGLVLDGNTAEQTVPPLPAHTHDNLVWQHGNAITGCFDGFEVSQCVFKNLRGHGINFNWASNTPDEWARPQNLEIHHNEFVNVFTQACNAGYENTRFHHNRLHGHGFWVGGLDIEAGDPRFAIRRVHAFNNVYDFRDGLSPVEGMLQFASDSRQAQAGRRHTRKAVTAFCPGDRNLGTMQDVLIENETIYQGTIYCSRFDRTRIRGVRIRNAIAEDLVGYGPSSANAISIAGLGWKLADCEVSGFDVESVLDGQAVYISEVEQAVVAKGSIEGVRDCGIRFEASGGSISDIEARAFGADDSDMEPALVGTRSSAVVVFGGQSHTLDIANVRAREPRAGTARRARHAVYANVAADPVTRVRNVTGDNLIGGVVRDVNRSLR